MHLARRRGGQDGSNDVAALKLGGSAGSAPPPTLLRRPRRRHASARLRSMSAHSSMARWATPCTSLGAGTARTGRTTWRRWSWVGAPGALLRRLCSDAPDAATRLPVCGACRRTRPWLGGPRRAPRSAPAPPGRVERRGGAGAGWERRERSSADSAPTPPTPPCVCPSAEHVGALVHG